jgi:hypothetical protein
MPGADHVGHDVFNLINGQRRIISLHQRVSLLPSKHSDIKGMLTAIKWLVGTSKRWQSRCRKHSIQPTCRSRSM